MVELSENELFHINAGGKVDDFRHGLIGTLSTAAAVVSAGSIPMSGGAGVGMTIFFSGIAVKQFGRIGD